MNELFLKTFEQCTLLNDEPIALLYIQGNEQSCLALQRAARRIRSHVRQGDWVWWCNIACIVALPGTPLEGAQSVAKRIAPLLVDVECEVQILYGSAAFVLLQRLQAEQTMQVVDKETESTAPVHSTALCTSEEDELPYLAFLADYPSHRLLHLFPYELACQYRCVPVGVERRVLTVATCQRLDYNVVVHFQEVTQRNIFQVRCEAKMIDEVLRYWQRTLLT